MLFFALLTLRYALCAVRFSSGSIREESEEGLSLVCLENVAYFSSKAATFLTMQLRQDEIRYHIRPLSILLC